MLSRDRYEQIENAVGERSEVAIIAIFGLYTWPRNTPMAWTPWRASGCMESGGFGTRCWESRMTFWEISVLMALPLALFIEICVYGRALDWFKRRFAFSSSCGESREQTSSPPRVC